MRLFYFEALLQYNYNSMFFKNEPLAYSKLSNSKYIVSILVSK